MWRNVVTVNTNKLPKRVIIDTDTAAEIDDQFAIVHALLSKDKLDICGITAAPFLDNHVTSPKDGMEMSHKEIKNILNLMNMEDEIKTFSGSKKFIKDINSAQSSDATNFIIEQASISAGAGEKLYIICIAALTNIANAILLEPAVAEQIEVIWLGGHPYDHHRNDEFNLTRDIVAAQTVFASNAMRHHVPCDTVAEKLELDLPQLKKLISGNSPIEEYLRDIFKRHLNYRQVTTKVLWDVAATAYLIQPNALKIQLEPKPTLKENYEWDFSAKDNNTIYVVKDLTPHLIFNDLFSKIKQFSKI
jgi:inosine-uridine nucleoside N-ribohydrolase